MPCVASIAEDDCVSRDRHRRCRSLPCLVQPPSPQGLGCAATAHLPRERRCHLPACLGSVVVARSWGSAAAGYLPRGTIARLPRGSPIIAHLRDHRRRLHTLGNHRCH
jgi:hypothetical protein